MPAGEAGGPPCPKGAAIRIISVADGTSSVIQVRDSDTVASIKAKIKGAPNQQQRLIFDGVCLSDDKKIASCGILSLECPTLYLLQQPPPAAASSKNMDSFPPNFGGIYVNNLSGEGFAIEAQETDTVGGIKAKLHGKAGFPADQQRLLFEGKELSDDHTLSSLGISMQAGLTLYLIVPCPTASSNEPLVVPCPPAGNNEPLLDKVGDFVERKLDDIWFRGRVLRRHEIQGTVDIEYLDDGKIELGVDLKECHLLPSPARNS